MKRPCLLAGGTHATEKFASYFGKNVLSCYLCSPFCNKGPNLGGIGVNRDEPVQMQNRKGIPREGSLNFEARRWRDRGSVTFFE